MESCIAQNLNIPIKPLALHSPVQYIEDEETLEWNSLTVDGDFSVDELNTWMFNIVPDMSYNVDGDQISYKYQSTQVKTYMSFEGTAKTALFKSNSVSTLSIVLDSLIKQSSLKSKQLNIKRDINPESQKSVQNNIERYFLESYNIKKEFEMLAALSEIKNSQGGFEVLSDKNKDILYREEEIKQKFEDQPKNLKVLEKVLISLCDDFASMSGSTNKFGHQKIKEIVEKQFDKKGIYECIVKS